MVEKRNSEVEERVITEDTKMSSKISQPTAGTQKIYHVNAILLHWDHLPTSPEDHWTTRHSAHMPAPAADSRTTTTTTTTITGTTSTTTSTSTTSTSTTSSSASASATLIPINAFGLPGSVRGGGWIAGLCALEEVG